MLQILLPAALSLLDKLIPDREAAAKAKTEMEATLVGAATEATLAQLEVNKIEAGHRSIFVAGWRPAIGWICVLALGWTYIGVPVAKLGLAIAGVEVELPVLETDSLMELLFGMLGLSGLRTFEKSRGITK